MCADSPDLCTLLKLEPDKFHLSVSNLSCTATENTSAWDCTDSTANYLLFPRICHEPQEWFLHQLCPFSFSKQWHFPCFTTEAKNSIFHFLTSWLYQKCDLCSKHRHWEQTEGLKSCEEPTQDQSKLGTETIISPFRRGWCFEQITKYHKLKTNTPPLKNTFPRKQFKQ